MNEKCPTEAQPDGMTPPPCGHQRGREEKGHQVHTARGCRNLLRDPSRQRPDPPSHPAACPIPSGGMQRGKQCKDTGSTKRIPRRRPTEQDLNVERPAHLQRRARQPFPLYLDLSDL